MKKSLLNNLKLLVVSVTIFIVVTLYISNIYNKDYHLNKIIKTEPSMVTLAILKEFNASGDLPNTSVQRNMHTQIYNTSELLNELGNLEKAKTLSKDSNLYKYNIRATVSTDVALYNIIININEDGSLISIPEIEVNREGLIFKSYSINANANFIGNLETKELINTMFNN